MNLAEFRLRLSTVVDYFIETWSEATEAERETVAFRVPENRNEIQTTAGTPVVYFTESEMASFVIWCRSLSDVKAIAAASDHLQRLREERD